jgi:adenosylcobyric acid synthase
VADAPITGYEIHMGESAGPALARPAVLLDDTSSGPRPDGALSDDSLILATYVHGLFDRPQAAAALLRWAGLRDAQGMDLAALRERSLERLADAIEAHVRVAELLAPLA